MRFEAKELVVLAITVFMTCGALRTSDPMLFFSCWFFAWLGFGYIAMVHEGKALHRALFFAALTALFVFAGYRAYDSKNAISESLLASQIDEVKRLQNFIGGKDEAGLEEVFDLPEMVKFNILREKQMLRPWVLSPLEESDLKDFTKTGQIQLDSRYMPITRTSGGGFIGTEIPGGDIILPSKYIASKQKLLAFENSPLLPERIRKPLRLLDSTLTKDTLELLDTIHEKLKEDPNNIIMDDSPAPNYLGATSSSFWDKCIRLEPIEEKIDSSIENYLNTN